MDEILINTNTTGDQDQPGVAGFRGTQFVVVWADRQTGNIKAQLLGVNGVKSDTEFAINFPAARERNVNCRRSSRPPGFVVAWIEQLPGAPWQLKLRTFDQDSLSGPETQVSSAEVEPLIRPALARLTDNGFVVVWADKRAADASARSVSAADGTKNGTEFRANTVPGLHRVPDGGRSDQRQFRHRWRARLPGPLLVHLQIFNASEPVGTEQTTALDITEAAMTSLDSGRFVIAHVRSALDGEAGFDTTSRVLASSSRPVLSTSSFPPPIRHGSNPPGRRSRRCPAGAFSWRGHRSMWTTPPPERTSRREFSRNRRRSARRSRSTR